MSALGKLRGRMKHLVTNLLITAFVIGVVRGEPVGAHNVVDQIAQESRPSRPAMQVVEPPKYVAAKPDASLPRQQHFIPLIPKHPPITYQKQKPIYHKQHKQPNTPTKYTKVIPLNGHQRPPPQQGNFYPPKQPPRPHGQTQRPPQLVYSASTGRPYYANIQIVKSPKFSLPVQTINGIRAPDAKPPKSIPTTTTTTTTERPKRVKRIWPKRILDKMNETVSKNTTTNDTHDATAAHAANTTENLISAASNRQNKYAHRSVAATSTTSTTTTQTTPRVYRKVTRKPKIPSTTVKPDFNMTVNEWVPMMPSHYPQTRKLAPGPGRPRRRSDLDLDPTPADKRRQIYLQTYGIVPLKQVGAPKRKLTKYRKRKRQLNSNLYSGFSGRVIRPRPLVVAGGGGKKVVSVVTDLETGASRPRVVTKIKHHHHHHHHKYVRTVEKKVPVKVEVPKPYPVIKKVRVPVEKIVQKIVEKKVPYPVTVEKKVPFKVEVKVPQPYPVKVIEKEYVPKPYPVIQQVVKQVEVKVPHPVPVMVPVHVEKKVPYPVHVKVAVPVDRPVPYPVHVEKKVPVPYPVRVFVPQPYPVEKRVPYPVEVKVKEPYPVEVVRHVQVPVKVYVPRPYPVKVPHPVHVPVEKRVPYPVEVEKKVPVPVKVFVPRPYPVEKKVPVYVTKHVAVPVMPRGYGAASRQNAVQVITAGPAESEQVVEAGVTVDDGHGTAAPHTVTVHGNGHFKGFSERSDVTTPAAQHTVTVHGNGHFTGFSERSDATTPETTKS